MRPFKVCPKCGNPSLDVEIETVRNLVKSIRGTANISDKTHSKT